jgi:four helix bundle protein
MPFREGKQTPSGEEAGNHRIRNYRDLIVWQRAMALCTATYRATGEFPEDERFGLVSQMRRAAVSIPSNIAEGHGRLTKKDYRHFLGMARGSLKELETHILISHELGFLDEMARGACEALADEVSRMLSTLIATLHHNSR